MGYVVLHTPIYYKSYHSNKAHKKYNQIANDGIYAVIPNQRVCFSYLPRDLHVAIKTDSILDSKNQSSLTSCIEEKCL